MQSGFDSACVEDLFSCFWLKVPLGLTRSDCSVNTLAIFLGRKPGLALHPTLRGDGKYVEGLLTRHHEASSLSRKIRSGNVTESPHDRRGGQPSNPETG